MKRSHRRLLQVLLGGAGALAVLALLRRKAVAGVVVIESPARDSGPPVPSTVPAPPHVLSAEEVDRLFGRMPWKPVPGDDSAIEIDAAWRQANLVTVEIPQLAKVKGAPAGGRVVVHRAVADRVVALFAAWEKAGLLDRVLTWDGSFASRRIRGRTTVSKHAYGLAFDLNAKWNPLERDPAPAGAEGSLVELVPLAVQHGFTWGGFFTGRKDGMHFEVFR